MRESGGKRRMAGVAEESCFGCEGGYAEDRIYRCEGLSARGQALNCRDVSRLWWALNKMRFELALRNDYVTTTFQWHKPSTGGSAWPLPDFWGWGQATPDYPKPWRPTVNSAQELKFILHYARRVQYNLSANRKQAYPGCTQCAVPWSHAFSINEWDRITCVYVNRQ